MAASAENEPRRILERLRDVRRLYGQFLKFILPVSASCKKLAYTLLNLVDGIHRFQIKYNTGKEPLSVFCQLTLGLSDTLKTLQRDLISCARNYESDTLDASGWLVGLDDASIERLHRRLNPISVSVEIINEAMEMFVNHRDSRPIHRLT